MARSKEPQLQNVLHDTELGPDEYRTTNLENTEITKTF
jgi:hypothetical protein